MSFKKTFISIIFYSLGLLLNFFFCNNNTIQTNIHMWITVILHPMKMQRKWNRKEKKAQPANYCSHIQINQQQLPRTGEWPPVKPEIAQPSTIQEQLESRKITRFLPQHFCPGQCAASTSLLEGLLMRLLIPSLSWRDTHTLHTAHHQNVHQQFQG